MADFLSAGLGAGMQAWGLINAMQNRKWDEGQTVDQMNRQQEAISYGRGRWQDSEIPARDNSLNLIELFGGDIQNSRARLGDLAEKFPGLIESLMGKGSDPYARGSNPAMSSLLERMMGAEGSYKDAAGAAMNDYTGGGDPRGNDMMDRIMDLINGQGEQMAGLTDIGGWATGTRGRNDFINNTSERGIDTMNRNGMSPILQDAYDRISEITKAGGKNATLDALKSKGMGLFNDEGVSSQNSGLLDSALEQITGGALGTAGLTKAGGQAEQVGLNDVANGGQTPEAQYLLKRGMELSKENPLLPMDKVVQMAREEAARNGMNAYRKSTRDSIMRGGKAAGIVRGTGENDEFADILSREVSDAGRKAQTDQQGLQLQQTGIGAGMAGNAGTLTNNRYSLAGDLVKGMEGNATSRYAAGAGLAGTALQDALGRMNTGSGTAGSAQEQETRRLLESLGLMPRVSDAAGNQVNIFGQLGIGAEGQANNNLKTGLDAYNMYNTSRIGGMNAGTNQFNANSNAKTNSGNLLNLFLNGGVNANNSAFTNNLNTGQFGAQLNANEMNGWEQNFANNHYAGYQGGIENLLRLAGMGQSYSAAGLPQGGGIGQPNNSGAGAIMSNVANGLGKVNFGGLFNRPNTGKGSSGGYMYGDDPN